MSLKVTKKSMVKPAKETPKHSLWLSSLDLFVSVPDTHTPTAFFYPRRPQNNEDNEYINFFNVNTLKESLSRALVPFYPLAGRLKICNKLENNHQQQQRRLAIDCNEEGALFIEAETTHYALSDFEELDFAPNDRLSDVVIPQCDYTGGVASYPLLIVQLTRFKCGGIALGFAHHHQIGDGSACLYFIASWARLTRGVGLAVHPIFDRIPYFLPRCPPQVRFHHLEYDHPPLLLPAATTVSVSKFSKDQINALKLEAASSKEMSNYKLSTFEVLAGHVWRSACKARGLAHDQDVKVTILVDGRSRLALPQGFFGNAIFHAACVAKAGDVTNKPLWYAAGEIHKALRRMHEEEYLRSAIDHLESLPDITAIARGPHSCRCPNLMINSWARLPFYDTDFGWGEPIFGGNGGIRNEGQCYILQNPNGDGSLSVAAKLFTRHMPQFHKSCMISKL